MERETKEFSISSSRRPASQVMYWQGGELKIQTPPVPQVLQDNYKPCFHAWLTQKVTTSQFSPGECRITLVMTEKEWGLSLKKKQTWKAVVGCFFFFLLSHRFLTCTFAKVLADTLPMLPLLSAELHSDNTVQRTLHNLTSNARGNILTTIMKPTALCWKRVLSGLLA